MQGTYLSVLPKDILTLATEYREPKLIVIKDNAEEITFLFYNTSFGFFKAGNAKQYSQGSNDKVY